MSPSASWLAPEATATASVGTAASEGTGTARVSGGTAAAAGSASFAFQAFVRGGAPSFLSL
eukprot:12424798-Alexandrium_andersonii.AAC.1